MRLDLDRDTAVKVLHEGEWLARHLLHAYQREDGAGGEASSATPPTSGCGTSRAETRPRSGAGPRGRRTRGQDKIAEFVRDRVGARVIAPPLGSDPSGPSGAGGFVAPDLGRPPPHPHQLTPACPLPPQVPRAARPRRATCHAPRATLNVISGSECS